MVGRAFDRAVGYRCLSPDLHDLGLATIRQHQADRDPGRSRPLRKDEVSLGVPLLAGEVSARRRQPAFAFLIILARGDVLARRPVDAELFVAPQIDPLPQSNLG
ncbi:hypothetical protein SR39_10680 [Methylobacterium radiotolerans]|jgi:hypothetical protein|nr:hypothetical protein SR39_10680 [Methylobacterium radiotolerans]